MDNRYQLTHDDSAAPGHYGWKQRARFDQIQKDYQAALSGSTLSKERPTEADVRRIIKELDPQGRWISTYAGERLVGQPEFRQGFQFISSAVLARNVEVLSDYIASQRR